MTLEDIDYINSIPHYQFIDELEKEASAPKEPELTGIRKHLRLIGIRKGTFIGWGLTLAMATGLGFIFYNIDKAAREKVKDLPIKTITMQDLRQDRYMMRVISENYIHDNTMKKFAFDEAEMLNDYNATTDTLKVRSDESEE